MQRFKLLTEMTDFNSFEVLKEGDGDFESQNVKIRGPFIQAEVQNRNKRRYKKEVCQREVEKFVNEKINTNRAVGELEHPQNSMINLERVSHKITSLQMHGNDGVGEAKILETPMGKIAKALILEGVLLGVSTRGLGTVGSGGWVNDDFNLITVDIVAEPSAPTAFVDGILEGKEFVFEGNKIVEMEVEKFKKELGISKSGEIKNLFMSFIDNVQKNI